MHYEPNKDVTQIELHPARMPATASPITDAKIISRSAYVYSGQTTLFIIPADRVIGFNERFVKVHDNYNYVVYNFMGEIVESKPDWS